MFNKIQVPNSMSDKFHIFGVFMTLGPVFLFKWPLVMNQQFSLWLTTNNMFFFVTLQHLCEILSAAVVGNIVIDRKLFLLHNFFFFYNFWFAYLTRNAVHTMSVMVQQHLKSRPKNEKKKWKILRIFALQPSLWLVLV